MVRTSNPIGPLDDQGAVIHRPATPEATQQARQLSLSRASLFDVRRALFVRRDIFPPLRVRSTRPLRAALASGDLHDGVPVVVSEGNATPVVLLRRELCFHHVAQGEIAGEPWMVSF